MAGCAAVAALTVLAAPATAESEGTSARVRDEILVTTSRREENLQDVAAAVVSIDPSNFTTVGLTNLKDVISYTPGMTFNFGVSPGSGNITARGVPQSGSTPVVGVYLDDVPFSTNTPYAAGSSLLLDGLLGDVERVEVVKGPQGTLYGAVAVGGLVKYVTRKPSLDEFRATAGVNISSTKNGGINQLYDGRISMPLLKDRLGVTISGFYEDNSGYVDVIDLGTLEIAHKNANTSERWGLSADALLQITDRASARFKYFRHNTSYPLGSLAPLVGAASDEAAFGPYITHIPPGSEELQYTSYSGTLEYDFGWATLTSTASSVHYDKTTLENLTVDYADLADFYFARPFGTTTSLFQDIIQGSSKFVEETRLTSASNGKFEWIIGGFYANEDTSNIQNLVATPVGPWPLGDINYPSHYEEIAVFGDATYYLTSNLDVTAGARLSFNNIQLTTVATGILYTGLPDATVLTDENDKYKDTVDTYLATVRYRPSENTSLYFRAASGYRPASNNTPVPGLAEDFLASDSLWSYEVGAKGSISDGLFDYEIAFWKSDWKDIQSPFSTGIVSSALNYAGVLKSKGIEGTLGIHPFEGFDLTTSATYTDSDLSKSDPNLGVTAGQRYPNVPKFTSATQWSYHFTPGTDYQASVGGGVRYIGGSESGFPVAGLVPVFVEGYVLTDLNASITKGKVTAAIYATNLFDANALEFRADYDFGLSLGSYTRPRTIGGSIRVNF